MRTLFVLLVLLNAHFSFAQTLAQDLNHMQPKEEYTNVKSIPIHSDENTSVFIIYIKQAVKKHVHQYHTEVVTVLDGKGRMYLGGDYFDVSKGDHIVIPPNTAHAVITTSGKPLKVMSVQSPQFFGDDRIVIEDSPEDKGDDGTKDTKEKDDDDDIPEFEGDDD